MRILIASADYPPDGGGIGAYAHGMWNGLNALGQEATVLSRLTALRCASPAERLVEMESGGTLRRNLASCKAWFRELARETQRRDCDWTVIPTWDPVAMSATVPLFRNAIVGKVAVVFHGSDVASASGRKAAIMRHVMRSSDRLISNSGFTRALIERTFGKSSATVHPAIGEDDFEIIRIERKPHGLISVGRLVPRKGHAVVIQALARLIGQYDGLHYTIVGDGPERAHLEELAQALGVRERITFTGQVSAAVKRQYLAAASIFVLPVREDPSDPEGFGIAYLEAGAAGLPVLATRTGGVAECVREGESGLFCDESVGGVEHGLATLVANKELRRELGEGGRRVAARSLWVHRAQDLIDSLEVPA